MPSHVFAEGDVDRAIIRGIWPEAPVADPDRGSPEGREAAVKRAALTTLKVIGPSQVVLMLDRNGFTQEQIVEEVRGVLRNVWNANLVLAGLPNDELITRRGITRFTSDDYLLRLTLEAAAFTAFCGGENNLAYVPESVEKLNAILDDVKAGLGQHEIAINTAKRELDIVRAIVGFQARRAVYAERIIGRCPPALRNAVLGTLLQELRADPAIA